MRIYLIHIHTYFDLCICILIFKYVLSSFHSSTVHGYAVSTKPDLYQGILATDSVDSPTGPGRVISVSAYDADSHCQKVLASLQEDSVFNNRREVNDKNIWHNMQKTIISVIRVRQVEHGINTHYEFKRVFPHCPCQDIRPQHVGGALEEHLAPGVQMQLEIIKSKVISDFEQAMRQCLNLNS